MDIEQALQQVSGTVAAFLPSLVAALLILVVGWLIAMLIASLVRRALHRTHLDDRLERWITGQERSAEGRSEAWIATAVFYLLMLFVLVAVFQTLGLTAITAPLNQLLVQVFAYAPRLLGAALLFVVAWILASLLRLIVTRALTFARVDERLRQTSGDVGRVPLPHLIGEVVFWLTIIVFLPAILGALALEGLLAPVQSAVDEVLRFLPNVFAAALIVLIGWLVARIAQRIVAGILAAVGVDRFAAQAGVERLLGDRRLSGLIGLVVYALILIPALIAALDALQMVALTAPATAMLAIVLAAIPAIIATALVLIVAYVLARVVAGLVSDLLTGIGFDRIPARLGIARAQEAGGRTPSQVVGYLVLVAIMLFATVEALRLLGFDLVAALVADFLVFAGQIVLGLIIFALGLFLANVAAGAIRDSRTQQAGILALAARASILVLAAAMALRQMGLAPEIVNLAFGILLGAVAVAAALAFGLGGRDVAGRELNGWVDRMKTQESSER